MNTLEFLQNTWCVTQNTYLIWFRYWWLFIALYTIAHLLTFVVALNSSIGFLVAGILWDPAFFLAGWYMPYYPYSIILSALYTVYYATLFCSARPIQETKNYTYFLKYTKYIGIMLLWFCMVSLLYHGYWYCVSNFIMTHRVSAFNFIFNWINQLLGFLFIIFNLFLMTAFFDTQKASLKQAFIKLYTHLFTTQAFIITSIFLFTLILIPGFIAALVSSEYTVSTYMYIKLCIDLLISAPILVIITTCLYYKPLKCD